jgi:hypothetical protein
MNPKNIATPAAAGAEPGETVLWSPSDTSGQAGHAGTLRLFALQGSNDLGRAIAERLGRTLNSHEEREFEDGEHKIRPLDAVRDADVHVIHSLHGGPSQSANDKLCRLIFFIGALKDAGAERVTVVAPYLCYARGGTANEARRLQACPSLQFSPYSSQGAEYHRDLSRSGKILMSFRTSPGSIRSAITAKTAFTRRSRSGLSCRRASSSISSRNSAKWCVFVGVPAICQPS